MSHEWIHRDPLDLLTHKRFDVVIKYLYAKNQHSRFYKSMYREHLQVWNNFSEKEPPKHGFPEFDRAFKSIIGNPAATPPIPVNANGDIPNGAHRLAAALHLQRPIKTRDADSDEQYPIVADHNLFERKDLPKYMMGRAAVEYAKLKPNTHVICLFPIAHTKYWRVLRIIDEYVNVFYKSQELLNRTGQVSLMKEIYLNEGWVSEAGIQKKSDQCFGGDNVVSFLLVDAENLETVKEMKQKIREQFDVGNHSVHISDWHHDAVRIAKTVFNENSIHFLNNRKYTEFANHTKLLSEMEPDDSKVISGSAVLSLYGLRDCKDIDLVYDTNEPPADAHNQYIGTHYGKLTLDDIMNDPRNYLYYQGFKYASLDITEAMKKSRNEPKDIKDINLIKQIGRWGPNEKPNIPSMGRRITTRL